jgi:glycerol-3-phosphate acyltransferase PlsX
MRIAVDAMGGDHAPSEIVRGAVAAAGQNGTEIILVGNRDVINAELTKYKQNDTLITIVHTDEVVAMDEPPALALRKKKKSSIWVATQLVKSGEAQAVVSAGSTGAQMAAALLILGRVPEITRPAIAAIMPTLKGGKLLLDVGANVDCKPQHLLQFAYMGSVYAERVLKIKEPRIGLLNIGTENSKGNELTLATHASLIASSLNFIGNVEAREIPHGEIDVIVCDGFVGNAVLKFGEGLVSAVVGMARQELNKHFWARLGILLVVPTLKRIIKNLDYTEYGGAPLLGVEGVSIVCHGSSMAKSIRNAIRLAVTCVHNQFISYIGEAIKQ